MPAHIGIAYWYIACYGVIWWDILVVCGVEERVLTHLDRLYQMMNKDKVAPRRGSKEKGEEKTRLNK